MEAHRKGVFLFAAAAALSCASTSSPGDAAPPPKAAVPRADLADQAQGRYSGDVISDARGSSRSNVRITVTKIGPNKVRVVSDYPRLPPFEARLSRYMQTIQNSGGPQVFLIDLSKNPPSLDVTVDDASWSGTRE
jgi:hypothetical protein